MPKGNPNKLLVEGDEEKRVIPYLMDKYVAWGNRPDDWVVGIKEFGGIEGPVEARGDRGRVKGARIKGSGNHNRCKRSIRFSMDESARALSGRRHRLSGRIAAEGVIHQNEYGVRIGVWIMPDNQSRGMLETFLGQLIAPADAALWAFAQDSCARSRDHARRISILTVTRQISILTWRGSIRLVAPCTFQCLPEQWTRDFRSVNSSRTGSSASMDSRPAKGSNSIQTVDHFSSPGCTPSRREP